MMAVSKKGGPIDLRECLLYFPEIQQSVSVIINRRR